MQQRIIFFGSGSYTIPIVEMLQTHGLMLVVTTEQQGNLIDFLKKQQLPFLITTLTTAHDRERLLNNSEATLAILASYGAILPKPIIEKFKQGILNIHPSLLPKYRGPNPIQTTILNGDEKTGVSIIKLDERIDHGPIISQKNIELKGDETSESLINQLFKTGAEMLLPIIRMIEQGKTPEEKKQYDKNATYTKIITRKDGFIDIKNPPLKEILDRKIRAYYPWPGVWLQFPLYGKTRRIKLLPNNKIQPEGKKIMSYKEFINGYQEEGEKLLNILNYNF